MNEEGKFWVAVWRTVAAGLVGLSAVIASCTAHNTAAVRSMVDAGANPIDAKCALDQESRSPICVVRALKQ